MWLDPPAVSAAARDRARLQCAGGYAKPPPAQQDHAAAAESVSSGHKLRVKMPVSQSFYMQMLGNSLRPFVWR